MVCEFDHHPHEGPCPMWAAAPDLTCHFGGKQTFGSGRIGTENRVLPAPLPTAGELADTYKEGST